MALQSLFGDDEHTGADGPYTRLMRVRKWMYLSSGVLALLVYDLYSPDDMKRIIPPLDVPVWLIGQAVLIGLLYLLLQFSLLSFQLMTTYDIILRERLKFRRLEELNAARVRLKEASDEHQADVSARRAMIEEQLADNDSTRRVLEGDERVVRRAINEFQRELRAREERRDEARIDEAHHRSNSEADGPRIIDLSSTEDPRELNRLESQLSAFRTETGGE